MDLRACLRRPLIDLWLLSEHGGRGAFILFELYVLMMQYCTDPLMLDFLDYIRQHQPSRALLANFFRGKMLHKDSQRAVSAALAIEAATQRQLTFLTVTNMGAAALNRARVLREFPEAVAQMDERGVLPDPSAGDQKIVIAVGMTIRLTRNLDKDRGFVNGAIGIVEQVLHKSVFVLRTPDDVRILVHPVHDKGIGTMPATYGYAMTIRRAQGCTLEKVAIHFDRRRADRGYAYVANS